MSNVKVNGKKIRTSIIGKANGMLVSVNIKKINRGLFHTSKGEVELSFNISCIQVDSIQGSIEYIAGSFSEARELARRIMKENIAFEDVCAFIELEINIDSINEIVERALVQMKDQSTISPKEIQKSNISSILL